MNPKITCHTGLRFTEDGVNWRAAEKSPRDDGSEGRPFRTCDYCGSIHPKDLLTALENGARLGGSDWKYGWPHKFYVYGIPNPNQGAMVRKVSGGNYKSHDEAYNAGKKYLKPEFTIRVQERVAPCEKTMTFNMTGQWFFEIYEPAGATTQGKWYNEHLQDEMTDDEFKQLAEAIEKHSDIKFEFGDDNGVKRLRYSAPYAGFQK